MVAGDGAHDNKSGNTRGRSGLFTTAAGGHCGSRVLHRPGLPWLPQRAGGGDRPTIKAELPLAGGVLCMLPPAEDSLEPVTPSHAFLTLTDVRVVVKVLTAAALVRGQEGVAWNTVPAREKCNASAAAAHSLPLATQAPIITPAMHQPSAAGSSCPSYKWLPNLAGQRLTTTQTGSAPCPTRTGPDGAIAVRSGDCMQPASRRLQQQAEN